MKTTRWLLLCLLSLGVVTCGDDDHQCHVPADCVSRPVADTCMKVSGRAICVLACAATADADSCPTDYACTGKGDDGSPFCKLK
jgi:hypothetical protein